METKKYELIKDAIGYSIPSTAKGKLYKNPENVFITRTTKFNGRVVYVRSADGFIKMIETTVPSKYKFFDANSFKLVETTASQPKSSFSGADVLNSEMLDDDFSNFNYPYKNINSRSDLYYPKSNFSAPSDLHYPKSKAPVDLHYPKAKAPVDLHYPKAKAPIDLHYPKVKTPIDLHYPKKKSDLHYPKVSARSYFNGEDQSNAIGDWWRETFGKDKDSAKLADENKVIYTESEAKKLHEKSGNKTPFQEWIKSDSSKQFLANLANFGSILLMNNANNKGGTDTTGNKGTGQDYDSSSNSNKDDSDKKSKEIWGMHPITFTGVIILASVGAFFGGRYLIRKGASKVKA